MNATVRKLLAFLAVVAAALVAVNPVGLPPLVSAVLAAVVAGAAAVGILPPSWRKVADGLATRRKPALMTKGQWAGENEKQVSAPAHADRRSPHRYPRIPEGRGTDSDC